MAFDLNKSKTPGTRFNLSKEGQGSGLPAGADKAKSKAPAADPPVAAARIRWPFILAGAALSMLCAWYFFTRPPAGQGMKGAATVTGQTVAPSPATPSSGSGPAAADTRCSALSDPEASAGKGNRNSGSSRPVLKFSPGSSAISETGAGWVEELKELVRRDASIKVLLNGYASNEGTLSCNQSLSLRRAQALKAYLVAKGVNKNNLTARGLGVADPIASNDEEQGRAQNRRVEIIIP